MKSGDFVRLPDKRIARVMSTYTDGVGIQWASVLALGFHRVAHYRVEELEGIA